MASSTGQASSPPRLSLLLALVQLVALSLMLSSPGSLAGFPLDDAWIHEVVARNLARTGSLGLDPALYGSGATSFLWPVLLALNFVAGSVPPALYAFALNSLAYLGCGQIVLRLLLSDGLAPGVALFAAALFSVAGNFVWFAVSGMEATLLAFLSLLAIHFWMRDDDPAARGRDEWLAGTFLGLLFLTRVEAGALLPMLALIRRGKEGPFWRSRLRLGVPVAAAAGLYFGLNLALRGFFSPSTLVGRRWMWFESNPGLDGFERMLILLELWASRLQRFTLGTLSPWPFWVSLGLAGAAVVFAFRDRASRTLLVILWCILHVVVYVVLMPSIGHGGRYQPLVPAVFLMCSGLGAAGFARGLSALTGRPWRGVRATFACLALALALRATFQWSSAQAAAVQHVNDTEVQMGLALRTLAPESTIASFDVGGIVFFADRPILDLGGLSDPSFVPVLQSGEVDEWLQRRRVEYVVLPLAFNERFPDPWNFGLRLGLLQSERIRLEPLVDLQSPREVWREGLEATLHCAPRQGLFRVIYADAG